LITTGLKRDDLLRVFAPGGLLKFLAVIEDLWRKNPFSTTLGGLIPGDTRTEAEVLAQGMTEIGIPAAQTMLDGSATNTGEHVVFSLPIIDRYLGLKKISFFDCGWKILHIG
jgi:DUF218 domain